jgi:hypothetical protein
MLSPYRMDYRLLDPDSVAFDVLRGWMDVCQEQHSRHRSRSHDTSITDQVSLRVIDCATRTVIMAAP